MNTRAQEIMKEFISNLNIGKKDVVANVEQIYHASDSAFGEPILNEQGKPTGLYVRDTRLRALQGQNGRRVITLKLHD
ncbi:MAG: hypothetical protein AAB492_01865 [Patescibacteria group bacterium]